VPGAARGLCTTHYRRVQRQERRELAEQLRQQVRAAIKQQRTDDSP
jgi:hypothetical protein